MKAFMNNLTVMTKIDMLVRRDLARNLYKSLGYDIRSYDAYTLDIEDLIDKCLYVGDPAFYGCI